jgi:hypothetical protein
MKCKICGYSKGHKEFNGMCAWCRDSNSTQDSNATTPQDSNADIDTGTDAQK